MIAIVTVLLALPAGYFLRSRLAANVVYGLAYLWAFTYQTLYLLLDSLTQRKDAAFGSGSFPLSYGLVTAAIFAVGFGLVSLGHWLRTRRATATPAEAG